MAISYAVLAKNARLNADTAQIGNAGLILLYSGARAANPDTAIGAQVLLVTLTGGTPFAAAAAAGVLTANAITGGTGTAGAGGGLVATWGRVSTSASVGEIDFSVGITGSGADMILTNTNIATGQSVTCSSFTLTHP